MALVAGSISSGSKVNVSGDSMVGRCAPSKAQALWCCTKGWGERVWVLLFDLAIVVEATQRVWRDGMSSGHLELVPNFGYNSLSIS
jgi:hypothetical protein